MSRWMIDDLGDIRPAGPVPLAASLGVPAPMSAQDHERLEEFGILNVGLIIAESLAGGSTFRCRPSILSQRAIATLGYWLLDNASRPVSITWYDNDWDCEHAPDAKTAISFVSYLLELKRRTPLLPAERIRAQPSLQASRRWQQVKARVSTLTTGPVEFERYASVLDPLFFGRWTIVEVASASQRVDVLARGEGYPLIDPLFAPIDARKAFEELPDETYRNWVHQSFIDVATHGRARFDDVDAIVNWPRFGDLRTRYWRMVVPLWSNPSRAILLNASGNDSGIDLRPKFVEEPRKVNDCVVASHP